MEVASLSDDEDDVSVLNHRGFGLISLFCYAQLLLLGIEPRNAEELATVEEE